MDKLTMKTIIDKNSFSSSYNYVRDGQIELYIHGFCSMLNHGKEKDINTEHAFLGPSISVYKASKDIEENEEIFINYCEGAMDKQSKVNRLSKSWGIVENYE